MDEFKGQPRLPKFAVPKRYDVRLRPDLVACEFSGTVSVDVDVVSDTRFLVLNTADLSVVPGSVSFSGKNSSEVSSWYSGFSLCLFARAWVGIAGKWFFFFFFVVEFFFSIKGWIFFGEAYFCSDFRLFCSTLDWCEMLVVRLEWVQISN